MRKKTQKFLLLLFAITIMLISSQVQAQGFYLEFKPGYNFATGGEVVYSYNYEHDPYEYTAEVIDGVSYGKGLNLNITGGYMVSKNFGVELGVSYLFGQAGGETKIDHHGSFYFSPDSYLLDETNEHYGNIIRFAPGIRLSTKFSALVSCQV